MTKPLTGVNLGGWLVLEKWMTPALFAGTTAVDEYSFCQLPGAAKKLKTFRDSFITEKDFAWLAAHGVQLVRLPVGYWLFGDAAPYAPTMQYVDRAFDWADKYGLKILLDVHAAPGSQNGHDHSGQAGGIDWEPDATLTFVERLCQRYGQHLALWGIELLNEPSPRIAPRRLANFYRQGYQLVVSACAPDIRVVIHDAFRPGRWFLRLPRWCYPRLVIDHHQYQIFTPRDQKLTADEQIRRSRRWLPWQLRFFGLFHPQLIGEWSGALPVQTTSEQAAQYVTVQIRAFRSTVGWCYWSYKTAKTSDTWNYRAQIDKIIKHC